MNVVDSKSEIEIDCNLGSTSCPECGSEHVSDFGPCQKFTDTGATAIEREIMRKSDSGRLFVCTECGLGFRSPILSREDLESVYASYESPDWDYVVENRSAWHLAFKSIQKTLPNGGTVLDVGAYIGQFLELLPEKYKKFAIEPSELAGMQLSKRGVVWLGRFVEDSLADTQSFDAITLFDVFEHLESPGVVLEHLWSRLRPGGVLIISTGNCTHWNWKLLRGNIWYVASALHLRFISPLYCRRFAEKHSCKVTMQRAPHTYGSASDRVHQALVTLYFAVKGKGVMGRIAGRCLRMSKRIRSAASKKYPPFTLSIADHLYVVFHKKSV